MLKGEPLKVKFCHVNNDKIQKTIARCEVMPENLPDEVRWEFFGMFGKYDGERETVKIYAETICKDDKYSNEVGERVARKKIMKKFMSMLSKAANSSINKTNKELSRVYEIRDFALECEGSIIEYLKGI